MGRSSKSGIRTWLAIAALAIAAAVALFLLWPRDGGRAPPADQARPHRDAPPPARRSGVAAGSEAPDPVVGTPTPQPAPETVNRERHEGDNIPTGEESAVALDKVLARLDQEIAEARAAGDTEAVQRLTIRRDRVQRQRDAKSPAP